MYELYRLQWFWHGLEFLKISPREFLCDHRTKNVFLSNQLCYNFLSKLQMLWICYDCTAARTTGRVRQQPGFQGIELKQRVILAFSCSNLGLFEVMISGEKGLDFERQNQCLLSADSSGRAGMSFPREERDDECLLFGTGSSKVSQAALFVVV